MNVYMGVIIVNFGVLLARLVTLTAQFVYLGIHGQLSGLNVVYCQVRTPSQLNLSQLTTYKTRARETQLLIYTKISLTRLVDQGIAHKKFDS
jgi:hypothetical protein